MVATVRDGGRQQGNGEPHPDRAQVRLHQQGAQDRGKQVTDDVLNRVGIQGDYAYRSSPFVVAFMYVGVQISVVHHPENK